MDGNLDAIQNNVKDSAESRSISTGVGDWDEKATEFDARRIRMG